MQTKTARWGPQGLSFSALALAFLFLNFNILAAPLEPMLQPAGVSALVGMQESSATQTGLSPLVAMETEVSPSPITLVVMAPPEPLAEAVLVALAAQIEPAAAPLVAMENKTAPVATLVAMDTQIPAADAPLVAMADPQRPTGVTLVAMRDDAQEAEKAIENMVNNRFGEVVGPVAAAEYGAGTDGVGAGGVGDALAQGGAGGSRLSPLGASALVANTLAVVREAAPPQGVGAEVLMALNVNKEFLPDVIVAYRNNALAGDVLLPLSAVNAALGLGIHVDAKNGLATGWLLNNTQSLRLDMAAGEMRVGQNRIQLEAGQVAVGGEEIFISGALLAKVLGGEMVANFRTLDLTLTTAVPLPMQQARAREARWAQNTATNPYAALLAEANFMPNPFAALPNIGVNYSSGWEKQPDNSGGLRRTSDAFGVQLDGTLFYAATNFGLGLTRDESGRLSLTGGNLRLSRDAPSPTLLADWLGPLAARKIEVGDIGATSLPLSTLASAGRGLRLSNTPAGQVDDPERFVLEGDAPAGWDVEVYQNVALLAFQKADANNRYRFQALPLRVGVNDFRIVLYGPRGEQETRTARYVLGDAMLAQGQVTYDISLYEPNLPVVELGERQLPRDSQPTLAQRYAYGLTSNLTAVLAAYTGLTDNAKTLGAPAQAVAAGLRGTLLDTYWQAEALSGRDGTRRVAASLARQLAWGVGARRV